MSYMLGAVLVFAVFLYYWGPVRESRRFTSSTQPAAASATTATVTPPATPSGERRWRTAGTVFGWIVGVAVVAFLAWLGWEVVTGWSWSQSDVAAWVWGMGFWIFVVGMIIFVIAFLIPIARVAGAVIILVALLVPGLLIWAWATKPSPVATAPVLREIPLASWPKTSWPSLVIPANGKSEMVWYTPAHTGMHIVVKGSNFRLHTVYQGGHECAFGDNCPAGHQAGAYVVNESPVQNTVLYAFGK